MQQRKAKSSPSIQELGRGVPVITGVDLIDAIKHYRLERGPIPALLDSDGMTQLKEIVSHLCDPSKALSTRQLMDVLLILVTTDPAEDIVTSTVLSDLLGAFDCRVLGAVRSVIGLGGYNKGECLAECLALMCAKPSDAQEISFAKSMFFVLFAYGVKSDLLAHYYKEMNTDVCVAIDVFKAVKTLGNFGMLLRNPDMVEAYFSERMPVHDHPNVVSLGAGMFKN